MLGNNNQPDTESMSPAERHDAIMQQLDEIKRYVAGVYSKVDTEIDEIRKVVDRLDQQTRGLEQKIDRFDQIERTVRNIESTTKDTLRKVS